LLGWGKQNRIEPFRYVSAANQRTICWCWVANRSNRKYELKRFGHANELSILSSRARELRRDACLPWSSRRGDPACWSRQSCRDASPRLIKLKRRVADTDTLPRFATRVLFLSCRVPPSREDISHCSLPTREEAITEPQEIRRLLKSNFKALGVSGKLSAAAS